MSDPIISRIYDLKISGFDDSSAKLQAMTDAFEKMDAVKTKLNAKLQNKLDTGDSATIQQLTAKIKELEMEMGRLAMDADTWDGAHVGEKPVQDGGCPFIAVGIEHLT